MFGIIFVVKYATKYVEYVTKYVEYVTKYVEYATLYVEYAYFPSSPTLPVKIYYAQLFIKLVESPGRILFQFDTQEDIETMTLTGLFIFYLPQINKIPAHATACKRLSHV